MTDRWRLCQISRNVTISDHHNVHLHVFGIGHEKAHRLKKSMFIELCQRKQNSTMGRCEN